MDSIELSLFVSRMESVCTEMGAVLQKTAFSPNIKDRLDFSCAVFDQSGQLCAQAAHIPVHLGSMAHAMTDIVKKIKWHDGDCLILNDPFLGGTHLPDITLISPIFFDNELIAFVSNRAHYADIGASTPGSMPLATTLEEEGLLIPPTLIIREHQSCEDKLNGILDKLNNPVSARADISAQISANLTGSNRLINFIKAMDKPAFIQALMELNNYGERLARKGLDAIPNGIYKFTDAMDDDGQGNFNIPICLTLTINDENFVLDFNGTASQVKGNINCPSSVTAAAAFYCFYSLMPENTPPCSGAFRPLQIKAEKGSLINAKAPAAVAAGNVETSTRIVDVILGALSRALPNLIPAASHGSMNNVAMGNRDWDYYETLGGGMGAGPKGGGLSAIQTHMTNTWNTPIEILEMVYPLRIQKYAIRKNSAGEGQFPGGDGLIREYEFLQNDTSISLLTERRNQAPWGLMGGQAGSKGINYFNGKNIPAKITLMASAGDRLTIETPGGGGWGGL